MTGELLSGFIAERIELEEDVACTDCGDAGLRSSAPDDCAEWERDSYEDVACHCDAGLLIGFHARTFSTEEERI